MVDAIVLTGILDAHHITDTFHHADGSMVPRAVRTDRTDITVRNHHTMAAIPDLVTQTGDRRSKMMHVLLGLFQKMKGQSERTASSYSGKGADGIYGILQKTRRVIFFIRHNYNDI
jgi:hypothetical protein